MTEKRIRLWLQKHHINVKGEWLRAAIEWINIKHPQRTESQLMGAIMKQVLFSNLADSYEPPVKIPTFAKQIILPKQHLFQVIMVLDVSRSLYEQYREFTNKKDDLSWFTCDENNETTNENVKSTGKSNRMLRIELSDGVVNIAAFIYGGVISIDESTFPGTKLLTRGRVRCRHGIIFLNEDNCQVLGGECDQLYKDRLLFLEAKLEIKLSARKTAKEQDTKDGNKAILPFLKPKQNLQSEPDEVGNTQFSTNGTLNVSESALKKLEKRKNSKMQSMDEHLDQDIDKSIDTIQCTPIVLRKSADKLDDSHLFRVPKLPAPSNGEVLKKAHESTNVAPAHTVQTAKVPLRVDDTMVKNIHQSMGKASSLVKVTKEISGSELMHNNNHQKSNMSENMNTKKQSILSDGQLKIPILPLLQATSKTNERTHLSDRSIVSEDRLKGVDQTPIVPSHALEDDPSRSLNTSLNISLNQLLDTTDFLNTSKETTMDTSRSTVKRMTRELEKAAKGTRSITEFMSVLGERPILHRQSMTSAGDMDMPKAEEIEGKDTKATTTNEASTTRRSLYTTLSKAMAKTNHTTDEKGNFQNEASSDKMDDDFHTPSLRVKNSGPSIPPLPANGKELHDKNAKSVGISPQANGKFLMLKDSCVGTTPVISKQYPVVHHRFVEKRDVATSPFPVSRKLENTKVSTSILKIHVGSKQLAAPREHTPSKNETEMLRRKRQFETPISNGPPPQQDVITHERKVKKVQLISPERSPPLNRQHSALSSNGRNLSLTLPTSSRASSNVENPGNTIPTTPRLNSFVYQSRKPPNEGNGLHANVMDSQPPHPHPQYEFSAALQYKTMEIYERRSLLIDLIRQRRFWMLSKRVTVVPLCSKLLHDLRAEGDRWCLKVLLTDESAAGILCVASQELLVNLLGFDVSFCKMLSMDKRLNETELNRCKQRALDVMKAFIRLDIVFMLEVSRNSHEPPIITGITQLCEATVPAQTSVFFHQPMTNFE